MTEGYAADWTLEQLREPAQRVADRIDELTHWSMISVNPSSFGRRTGALRQ